MDPLMAVLIVLLVVVVFAGGSFRSRDLGIPWGAIIGVLLIVLLLRLLGIV